VAALQTTPATAWPMLPVPRTERCAMKCSYEMGLSNAGPEWPG
jgi:hypothetical protein